MEERRAYEEVRKLVEDVLRGKMHYQREGYQWGAWIIEVDGKSIPFLSNGSGYPELATVLKVKSKTTIKGKTSPSQTMTLCLNGT